MKKIILNIITSFFVILAVSCNDIGKSFYVSSFKRFVTSVSEKQDSYTDEDWEKADLMFEQFSDIDYQKYARKLTKEEKQEIGKLKGKYLAIRTKSAANSFMDNLQDALDQLGGVVEGFAEEFDGTTDNEETK
jgi:hypothetical protein